jgi:hypothetical protein
MLAVTDLIAGIFKPAAELVDELHTSEEERLKAQGHLLDVQAAAMQRVFEYETSMLEGKAKIVHAEASSKHWLTANWRPVTMLTFLGLVVARWFGFSAEGLTQEDYDALYNLISIGIGGYILGRSGEKIAQTIKK